MGRLSNPPNRSESLFLQEWPGHRSRQSTPRSTSRPVSGGSRTGPWEEKGRLSNPVQRRLSSSEVSELAELYLSGSSITALTSRFHIHRTTVLSHLQRHGIARRPSKRKLTDADIEKAADRYRHGLSLARIAAEYDVCEVTITPELRMAGVPIRPRRGWNP